jgi:NTP pyrophosphatase (non-canonical NTP hydrolase)
MSDLADFAATVIKHLREHFPAEGEMDRQVLALAEEAGEFTGAYRRWSGQARRTGTFGDMAAELADVVITAYVTAETLGIDLDEAWRRKAQAIMTRGWREPAATTRGETR